MPTPELDPAQMCSTVEQITAAARAASDAMTFDAPERARSRVVRTFEDDPPIVLDHRARECDARES